MRDAEWELLGRQRLQVGGERGENRPRVGKAGGLEHDAAESRHGARRALRQEVAQAVRQICGCGTKLSYAADWSEYGALSRDGGRTLHFPLDPLWSSPDIDFIGIRSVDADEKQAIRLLELNVFDMRHIDEHGMRNTVTEALHDLDDDAIELLEGPVRAVVKTELVAAGQVRRGERGGHRFGVDITGLKRRCVLGAEVFPDGGQRVQGDVRPTEELHIRRHRHNHIAHNYLMADMGRMG